MVKIFVLNVAQHAAAYYDVPPRFISLLENPNKVLPLVPYPIT